MKMASIDDELGEICSYCGRELDDQNRAGSEETPACRHCFINAAFLFEWIRRGGTPEAKEKMLLDTPRWLKNDLDYLTPPGATTSQAAQQPPLFT